MIFAGMALSLPAVWFFPWWSVAAIAFALGWIVGPRYSEALKFALAAGLVSAALAFIKDGRNGGIISRRMSELLSLPAWATVFGVVFLLAFVTAFLCFNAGGVLSKIKTVS